MEAPDVNYESIKTTRIKLEDNATCNIGVHFDIVADKIGRLMYKNVKRSSFIKLNDKPYFGLLNCCLYYLCVL